MRSAAHRGRTRPGVLLALCCFLLAATAAAAAAAASPGLAAPAAVEPAPAYPRLEQVGSLRFGGLRFAVAPDPSTPIGSPCGETPGLLCSTVTVPLDRTGATPGTIPLYVELLPASGPERGVMFLIAGGPGQGSATTFGLGDPDAASFYRFLFPGYTLVAVDNRGTGKSGLLVCPGLQGSYEIEEEAARVAACAERIGPTRVFYPTREHADDLDAVRQALGVEKAALWGTSYGTKLSLAYALAHPGNVERLLLDSMVPTDLDDPFRANSLRAMPGALADFCVGGICRAATPNYPADVVAVANQLAAKPVSGRVRQPNGALENVRLTGVDMLGLTIDADLNPGLAAALPAAARAARRGDTAPLLRLADLDFSGELAAEDLSAGLFAATVCNDGPFPWPPDTPVAARPRIWNGAIQALPAGALGPFGKWAARIGNGQFCLSWPAPSGWAELAAGPFPNVPVLAVNGGFDMRTPVSSAQAVIAKFPQGRLIVVPRVGHSVLGADPSFCAPRAVRSWILGESFSDQCPREAPLVSVVSGYPSRAARPLGPAQTYAAAVRTLSEAQALWFMVTGSPGDQVAGLYGGRIVALPDLGFRLSRYSIAPGVELSGRVRFTDFGPPLRFEGIVTVGGRLASAGTLGLSGTRVSGTLGGVLVGR